MTLNFRVWYFLPGSILLNFSDNVIPIQCSLGAWSPSKRTHFPVFFLSKWSHGTKSWPLRCDRSDVVRRLVSGSDTSGRKWLLYTLFLPSLSESWCLCLKSRDKTSSYWGGLPPAPAQDCQFIDYLQRIKPISNPIVTEVNPHTNIIGKVLSISFMQGYC